MTLIRSHRLRGINIMLGLVAILMLSACDAAQNNEAQVPVTSIQKLLGHAQLRSTEVYMHISDPKVQQDYETAMSLILKRSTWAVPL